ncbi:MAG: hypothetical protein K9L68_13610, partial [Spirochaetales bacterium]|nr:hypothetical protein [Spirochaetales bacterium]
FFELSTAGITAGKPAVIPHIYKGKSILSSCGNCFRQVGETYPGGEHFFPIGEASVSFSQ